MVKLITFLLGVTKRSSYVVSPPAYSSQSYLDAVIIIYSPVLSLIKFKVLMNLDTCTFLVIEVRALLCPAPKEQTKVSPLRVKLKIGYTPYWWQLLWHHVHYQYLEF